MHRLDRLRLVASVDEDDTGGLHQRTDDLASTPRSAQPPQPEAAGGTLQELLHQALSRPDGIPARGAVALPDHFAARRVRIVPAAVVAIVIDRLEPALRLDLANPFEIIGQCL